MDRTYKLIGLAKKAGRLVSGEKNCKDAIASGSAHLVILSGDAAKNTHKSITNNCKFYNVKYVFFGDTESLGHSIGNTHNAVVAICDEGLAGLIEKSLPKI